ncbi:MAG: protein jag [Oscillospiraceae bacterium]|jgi:spoIIIJ-associated protein|nr:protein jag [Oscillospiraceae bacterium]
MQNSIEVTGKTEEEAVASALRQLDLQRDEVSIEIVERARSGFLRIGASPAVVRVIYDVPDVPSGQDAEEKTKSFLEGLLSRMGVDAGVTIKPREGGGVSAELSGAGMGAIIGRRGETLDAIQHLTNYAVNRGAGERTHISVDAENYRSKREESLARLAEKMAVKALKYHRSMALEPMNSYERHVIHTALQNYEGVTTGSTGVEPNRRVVISCEKSGAGNEKFKEQR